MLETFGPLALFACGWLGGLLLGRALSARPAAVAGRAPADEGCTPWVELRIAQEAGPLTPANALLVDSHAATARQVMAAAVAAGQPVLILGRRRGLAGCEWRIEVPANSANSDGRGA